MLPSPRIIVFADFFLFERVIILCECVRLFLRVYEIFDKSSVWVRIWLLDGFLLLWVSDWKERNGRDIERERECGWHAVSARGAAHSRPRQLEREVSTFVCKSAWSGCQSITLQTLPRLVTPFHGLLGTSWPSNGWQFARARLSRVKTTIYTEKKTTVHSILDQTNKFYTTTKKGLVIKTECCIHVCFIWHYL